MASFHFHRAPEGWELLRLPSSLAIWLAVVVGLFLDASVFFVAAHRLSLESIAIAGFLAIVVIGVAAAELTVHQTETRSRLRRVEAWGGLASLLAGATLLATWSSVDGLAAGPRLLATMLVAGLAVLLVAYAAAVSRNEEYLRRQPY